MKACERRKYRRRKMTRKTYVSATLLEANLSSSLVNLALLDISEAGVRIELDSELPAGEFSILLDLAKFGEGLSGQLTLPCRTIWNKGRVYGLEFLTSKESCQMLSQVLKSLTSDECQVQLV